MAAEPAPPTDHLRPTLTRYVAGLDGYRGMAALLVLVFHVAGATGVNGSEDTVAYLTRPLGALGVSVFFVLSGFLLYRPFVSRHLADEASPPLGRYLVRRFLRLFPAYWLALTVYAYVADFSAAKITSWGDFLLFYGLQQSYVQDKALAGIPVAWTLTVELTFYLVLPLLALLPRALAGPKASPRDRFRAQLVAIGAIYVGATIWRWTILDGGSNYVGYLPAMADWFAAGMFLAAVRVWWVEHGRAPSWSGEVAGRAARGLGLFVACVAGVVALELPGNFLPMTVADHMTRNLLFALAGVCLLAPLALAAPTSAPTNPVTRVLELGWVRWLGTVSYGVYLWHVLVLHEVRSWLRTDDLVAGPSDDFWLVLVLTTLASVAVASVSWIVLERPILSWGHHITGGRSRARPQPEEARDPEAVG